jgi:CRISPR-associated protein Csm1
MMTGSDSTLAQSTRVALAALLHDLGKFAERARIEVPLGQLATWKQLDCPHWDGHPTHIHAAYTTAGFAEIEMHLPARALLMAAPFGSQGEADADDSLVNAAARHHRPDSFLQWVIASADRLASGFERQEFEHYNKAEEGTSTGRNHYQARLLSLFDGLGLESSRRDAHAWCQVLSPLTPDSLFPRERAKYEPSQNEPAQKEYKLLWQAFLRALETLPRSHRDNLPLWLDHLDSAWLAYTHAIPSATAGKTRPDVSLYDHSKAVTALAVALWRWHDAQGEEGAADRLRAQWDKERADRPEAMAEWNTDKFLLIQGDFSGIQDFIFAEGGQTQKQAAKLLRGRSFQVSLLSELAALAVLEALNLPPTSQIVNAAGKFLIVAANTEASRTALAEVEQRLDAWFLAQTYGEAAITLASQAASCNDFLAGRFPETMRRLFESLEEAKLQRFHLAGATAPATIREADFSFGSDRNRPSGPCEFDGRRPAETLLGDKRASLLAADQIAIGRLLADRRFDRLFILKSGAALHDSAGARLLTLDYFGYRVAFSGSEEVTGRFGKLAASGELRRCWDFSLPEAADAPLFQGYARRDINAYVPVFDTTRLEWEGGKYGKLQEELDLDREAPLKTLNHLACEDRLPKDGLLDEWQGAVALAVLKGDVDNLGSLFQRGIQPATFARMAALSRQMNAFFAVHLPWLCKSQPAYADTYTVFAGGDDFFLIGPWGKTQRLARQLATDFARYAAGNPEIHFSAGMVLSKPGVPIRALAHQAEAALGEAKAETAKGRGDGKNAVVCHGVRVTWPQFSQLALLETWLEERRADFSTGFVYRLLHLAEMAASNQPEDAIWQSWLAYRVRRFVVDGMKLETEAAKSRAQEEIAGRLRYELLTGKLAVRIPVANYLYRYRD